MKKEKLFYGWRVVIGCMILMGVVVPISIPLSTMYLVPITEEFGVSRSAFLIINTLMQSLGIFLSPSIAKLMSKGEIKKYQIIGIIGFALSYASHSFAPNIFFLYITGILQGFFFLMVTVIPMNMLIAKWFVAKRALAISVGFMGIGVGGFFFSHIVGTLLEQFGWRTTYQLVALIVLVIALPATIFLIQDSPEEKSLQPLGVENGVNETKKSLDNQYVSFTAKEALKQPFFIILLVGLFLAHFVQAGSSTHFAPAISQFHDMSHQTTIMSIFLITGVVGKLIMGWVVERFGIAKSILFGGLCLTICMLFLLQLQILPIAYLMAITFGLGSGLGPVVPPVLLSKIFAPEQYPEAFGIASSAIQVGLSTGGLAIAFLHDISGSYQLAWQVFLVLGIGMLVLLLLGWKLSQKQAIRDKEITQGTLADS